MVNARMINLTVFPFDHTSACNSKVNGLLSDEKKEISCVSSSFLFINESLML